MSVALTDSDTEPLEGATASLLIRVCGLSDAGRVRDHNEDNFTVEDLAHEGTAAPGEALTLRVAPQGVLLVVCDGMGGAAAGEDASRLAVETIARVMRQGTAARDQSEVTALLVEAIETAGAVIYEKAMVDPARQGMGTTATVAVIAGSKLLVGQVGDSRAYVLRGNRLVQMTRDQSLTTQLVEAGSLTEEEAEGFEHNNIITQALGVNLQVDVDVTHVELRRGDSVVVCSDGLHGMVSKPVLQALLVDGRDDPGAACRHLTDRANENGGSDNITVIVAKVEEGVPEPDEHEILGLALQRHGKPPATMAQDLSNQPPESSDEPAIGTIPIEEPSGYSQAESASTAEHACANRWFAAALVAGISVACACVGIAVYFLFF